MNKLFIQKNLPELQNLPAFHLSALKNTISYVKNNSRFYKEHLKNIYTEEIINLDAFKNLPFTFPDDIKKNSQSFLCVSQDDISRVITFGTSGTSGEPKRIFFTQSDIENTIEFFSFVISQLTRPMETVFILLPGRTPFSVGDILKTALDRIEVKAIIEGSISNLEQTIHTILNHQPSVIIGMPVQLFLISERFKEHDMQLKFVNHVILTSDYASPKIKKQIGQIFDCQVFDHYGMTETGFGAAMDCFFHQGYHLREADLYFEIVEPNSGETVEQGEWGEITITTLSRTGMPLVRYRTGDISRFLSNSCSCEIPFRLLDYIKFDPTRQKPHTLPLLKSNEILSASIQ